MNKTMLPRDSKQINLPWVSGSVVKKAIIPSFCFAVLSTVGFEKMVHAAPTVPSNTNVGNQALPATKYVNVTSGSLNVRSSASTNSTIITSLTKGTAVTILSEGNGWAKVQVNGKTGYVSLTYLSSSNPASSSASTPITKYVNVSSGSLNLRNGASTNATILTALSKGTAVTVLSEANGWTKVQVNGKTGYVSSSFLSASTSSAGTSPSSSSSPVPTTTKYVNITSGSLNMRNGASTNASVIVKLAKNTAVKVHSESRGWAEIEVYGKTGYVSSEFLSAAVPGTPAKPNETPQPQPITKYVKVGSGSALNVRKSASTSSAIVTKLANGTALSVLSETNGWAKIKVNGIEGFVSTEFLTTTQATQPPAKENEQKTVKKYVNVKLDSSLNMRKSPASDASILVKLARGVEVTVYSEANGWAKVEAYGQTGYVSTEFLAEQKPVGSNDPAPNDDTEQNTPSEITKYIDVVYGSSLNMRSAASTSATIVTKLARGTVVTVHSEANGWAQVTANGKTGYVSSQYLSETAPFNPTTGTSEKVLENYNISLNDMVTKEMAVSPQTDKKYDTYISADALTLTSPTTGIVSGTGWNVRGGAGTNYWVVGQVKNQDQVQILAKITGSDGKVWYQITYSKTWVNASPDDVAYYVNPANFMDNTVDSLQFLKLSVAANLDAAEVNSRILAGKGILDGLASAFITAGSTFGINEVYLIAHALLETNNGTSQLATGVEVNGQTVYNMYGIGAYDNSAITSGAQFAYNAGWFTPEAAIIGGAQFIENGYIHAGQDTLYKMRWNPGAVVSTGAAAHQYATDIGWAAKQVKQIYNIYSLLDSYKLILEVPQYK